MMRKPLRRARSATGDPGPDTTTQEARIVAKGDSYEIRINFCPREGRTRLLSQRPAWTSIVREIGGVIDPEKGQVSWPGDSARRYTLLLLFHEIAHILYAGRSRGGGGLSAFKSSAAEEAWCDRFAMESMQEVVPRS